MPYLMSQGKPLEKAFALYSCCEDELLAKAELLLLLEKGLARFPDGTFYGYLDTGNCGMSIAQFKAGYRGRPDDYRRLIAKRNLILAGGWNYPWFDWPSD